MYHDLTPERIAELRKPCRCSGSWFDGLCENCQDVLRSKDDLLAAAESVVKLREALTPSGATKAAYIGEFEFERQLDNMRGTRFESVPWTTIKEIMAAILKRAGCAAIADAEREGA